MAKISQTVRLSGNCERAQSFLVLKVEHNNNKSLQVQLAIQLEGTATLFWLSKLNGDGEVAEECGDHHHHHHHHHNNNQSANSNKSKLAYQSTRSEKETGKLHCVM